jgi:sugar phosphate isomerase/epimerase
MSELKIGVMAESFRLPLRDAIKKAAVIGAGGIQMYTLNETHPDNLSAADRANLLKFIKDTGLVVSALCGDFGGFGLEKQADNVGKISLIKKAIDLAVDLETAVVTTHIGTIPTNCASVVYQTIFKACYELARYAENKGVTIAIETGPETSATLRAFIEAVDSPGIGVNFDPANLKMVVGEDSVPAAKNLVPYIVHTHAKDGIQFKATDPVKIYHSFAGENPDNINPDDYFKEVPLGTGQVDFLGYIQVLRQNGYVGFHTVEREVGDQPEADITEAVRFLKSLKF